MGKERDLQSDDKNRQQTIVEIDIRKILEQMGISEEKWPEEWMRKETV
ncbi:hypothetical protein [Cohnella zeiphila]|uniref:Uncharacterized protein n=1 Tax=Cohnella zeiphila TaxID=2761120 RepID=A0A7X0SM16_9BACL|nr:hypothetical protein [Cohnella zeiphila]MBB6732477.1 hypothetical protein [Cohnella zeiphila]